MSGGVNRWLSIALAAIVLLSGVAVAAGAAPVVAADDPPELPAAYYGEVSIDGEPAPEGTIVEAAIDGEVRGSIAVGDDGTFGGPGVGDEKLEVPGDADDEGEAVTFLVGGVEADADPEITWASGAHEQVDLSAEDVGEPFFAVDIDETASTTTVEPGETATVVAHVENTGDAPGEVDVEFTVDDELEETEEGLALGAGETETLAFDVVLDDEGEYEAVVAAGAFDADEVTLVADADDPPPPPPPPPEPDPDEPAFELTDLDVPGTVDAGATFTATVNVTNIGDATGETTLLAAFGDEADQEKIVELAPGETEPREFEFLADLEAGTYALTIAETETGHEIGTDVTVEAPAVVVTDAELSATEIVAGKSVDVTATVENLGEADHETEISLTVDDETVATEIVVLGPGESTDVIFTETFDDTGEFAIAVQGVDAGTLTVTEPDIQVTAADVDETDVEVGESVEVTATVENLGDADGEKNLALSVDGIDVDVESVSVAAGETETVTFTHSFDEEGTFELAVNAAIAGEVTVTEEDDDGIPGFGAVAALLAIALALVAIGRRQR